MPAGSGAGLVHATLAQRIEGYRLRTYSPYWELTPLLMLLLRDPRADVVHTAPDYATFVAQPEQPLVITFHNYVLDPFMRPYSSFAQRLHYTTDLKWFTRKAFARATAVTAVSRFVADLVGRELGSDKSIRVIYNGVDTRQFTPASRRRAQGGPVRVLFSGNLTRRKGADLLPAIASRLHPGIEICYTAGLRTRHTLPALPSLRPLGPVSHREMADRYREADILLFPTVREGFGLAVAEAMACGLPVVASALSSMPELVDEGEGGFLCPAGDAAAFAERLNHLAGSPELRQRMGEHNRAKVERRFRLEDMIGRYRALFEEVRAGR